MRDTNAGRRPAAQALDGAGAFREPAGMTTRFRCPQCHEALEGESEQAGMEGNCPACGGTVVVAGLPPKVVRKKNATEMATGLAADAGADPAAAERAAPENAQGKPADEWVANAVCGTAKAGWKFAKWVAPIVGKAALRVAGRAADAAAPHVGKFAEGAVQDFKKQPKGPLLYYIFRSFFR